jgi:hypothetical protein
MGSKTDSGIFFRCGFNLPHGKFPAGCEANIGSQPNYKTGTILLTTAENDKSTTLFKVSETNVTSVKFFPYGKNNVRRAKACIFSGFESRPATFVPAGSNRQQRRRVSLIGSHQRHDHHRSDGNPSAST